MVEPGTGGMMSARLLGAAALTTFVGAALLDTAFVWSPEPWLVWPGAVLFVAGILGMFVLAP
ncbi:hypothetical protein GCM10027262_61750 [Nocardia tengchongensis]